MDFVGGVFKCEAEGAAEGFFGGIEVFASGDEGAVVVVADEIEGVVEEEKVCGGVLRRWLFGGKGGVFRVECEGLECCLGFFGDGAEVVGNEGIKTDAGGGGEEANPAKGKFAPGKEGVGGE